MLDRVMRHWASGSRRYRWDARVNKDAEFRPECGQQAALPKEHSPGGRKLMAQQAGKG